MNFHKFPQIVSISFLISISFFWFAPSAHAGLILNRPLYIGLTSGLVGNWSFDGPDMAGTTSYDRSGQGNNGTLTNGPTRAIGRVGQALEFDGVNDYVNAGSATSLDNLGPVTIAAWIYPRSEGEIFTGRIVEKTFLFFGFGTDITNALDFFVSHDIIEIQRTASDNVITMNSWQHVSVTWDGSVSTSNVHIYVNGREVSYQFTGVDASGPRSDDSANNFIIGNTSTELRTFDGLIDDVRIYNRALSADEIKRLYKIGATLKINKPAYTGSLTDGLVGFWSFDGPDMTGTTAYDRSGNANNGTLTNGPVRKIGRIGQALEFDGVDDYVSLGNPASLNITGNITVAAWIKFSASQTNKPIVNRWGIDQSYLMTVHYNGNNLISFVIRVSDVNQEAVSVNTYNDGRWHFVVGIFDGSNVRLNIDNGVENIMGASTAGPIDSPATNVVIGAYNNPTNFFTGLIDDVRIYNRALSSDEIRRLYKIGATTKINVPSNTGTLKDGLVGYWSFDGQDMAGSPQFTAYDRSGNNNHAIAAKSHPTSVDRMPRRAIGRIGQGLDYDKNLDYADIGNNSSINNLGPLTYSLWMYPRSSGQSASGILIGLSSNDNSFFLNGSFLQFGVSYNTTSLVRRASANSYKLNEWNYVTLTWDGSSVASNVHIYVNGAETTYAFTRDGATTRNDDSATIKALGNVNSASASFDGILDEVRIYNRVLSADEIKRLYNAGR